ncbi:hypothetical protein D020_4826 [Vibrio parahaemolyticus SBR10290]|nr:hypothetical protein D021_1165 [Vibrio parahaemolyticus 10296]ESW45262.1 hypothetical protein D022_1111 [Vibrio parahaemolyticus 12310]ETT15571.1 hypothetical protein D023_4722 [Vibrio parahaemolyticus 3256]ETX50323.1 hypothetical protein D020_4826 [Vibrio parahaemolyticus SBR10290]
MGFLLQTLIGLLKVCSAALLFQKVCLVFKSVSTALRFQVVSVTGAFKLRLI